MSPSNDGPLERTQAQRIFAAMRDLEQFTVSQLVHASGVNPSTVRTVLLRNSMFLEEIGREETGRRGGKFRRYRLTERGRRHVDRYVPAERERQLQADASRTWIEGTPFIPEGLRAAQETLTLRLPTAAGQTRQFLLGLARVDLWSAAADIETAAISGHDVTTARAMLDDLRARHESLTGSAEPSTETNAGVTPTVVPRAEDVERLVVALAARVEAQAPASKDLPIELMAEAAQEFKRAACAVVPPQDREDRERRIVDKLNGPLDTLTLDPADLCCVGLGAAIYAPGVLRIVRRSPGRERFLRGARPTKDESLAINIPRYLGVVDAMGPRMMLAPIERKLQAQLRREPVAQCW